MSNEERTFIGIDPGFKGALACISDSGKLLRFIKMPLRKDKKTCEHNEIYKFIAKCKNPIIILEQSVPFKMGTKGAFNYGRGFAAIEIAVERSGHPINYVYPQSWTRVLHRDQHEIEDSKERSLAVAKILFDISKVPVTRTGKVHDGIIDAILIAEYGRRTLALN